MRRESDEAIEPDAVTDWADWGRRQGSRWSGQARNWRSEAWTWSHPREQRPRPLWSRVFWGIIGLPLGLIGLTLLLALSLVGMVATLIGGALALWLAMGLISAGFASRNGWPSELGALVGFLLGPLGLFIARRLPERP